MRKVCYVTGTRADFGLLKSTLQAIDSHPDLELGVLVTGMHLLPEYGETWHEIVESGLKINSKVSVQLSGSSGAEMSIALGEQIIEITKAFQQYMPDIVLLLGDRGEMLAGAIAAVHLNIPIAHIHGGELSGTIDESIRHAISKLAHYHFTTTLKSRDRLIKMGEKPANVFVTGAPGLDEILQMNLIERSTVLSSYNLEADKPFLLVLFHPVVQQVAETENQIRSVLDAVHQTNLQSLVIMPNADAGGISIKNVINEYLNQDKIKCAIHVKREEYLSLLAYAEVLVGNSSSGIIEAASFNTPVVNIGDRQRCRERNYNVIDVNPCSDQILDAINTARSLDKQDLEKNVYGDGKTAEKIIELLSTISLAPEILEKVNAY